MHTETEKPSWLGRNWKWAVPLGCVFSLLTLAAFAAAIIALVFGIMRSSDAYRLALAEARSSPAVVEALGEPIEPGWYLTGHVNVTGSSGEADITIPVSGPRGEATIYAVAKKRAGEWEYELLEVLLASGAERIDLLD